MSEGEKCVEYYPNGKKRLEGTYKDGKRDGLWTRWHENGQMKVKGTFKDGEQDGLWTSWWENGQKKEEGTWKDDYEDGLWTDWYNMDYEIRLASEQLEKTKELLYRYRHDEKYGEVRSLFQADSTTLAVLQNHYKNDKNMVGRIRTYKDGELNDSKCWEVNGNEIDCKNYDDGW